MSNLIFDLNLLQLHPCAAVLSATAYTLDQGSVGNKWLPESQSANVKKTECGLVERNAPEVPVPCPILYSVIKSIEAG